MQKSTTINNDCLPLEFKSTLGKSHEEGRVIEKDERDETLSRRLDT